MYLGAKWFMQRKMLTPAFHFKMLEGFVEIFGRRGAQFTQFLQSKANGEFFDIQPDIHVSTLGVICGMFIKFNINNFKFEKINRNFHGSSSRGFDG